MTDKKTDPLDAPVTRRDLMQRAVEVDHEIQFGEHGAELTNWAHVNRFAQWAKESGLVDRNATPAQVMMQVQTGAELGFSPMQSLQVVHVVDGKPSVSVEAQAAKVEAAGAIEPGTKIRYRFEGDGEELACIAWSTAQGGEKIESEPVYLKDFKHLRGKDNWKNYPKRMLKARAVGWHIRDNYAGHTRNLITTEEAMDLRSLRGEAPVRDVTPPKGPDPLLAGVADAPAEEPEGEIVEGEIVEECEHPDGFAPNAESETPICIHCGLVEPGGEVVEPEQGAML